MARAMGGTKPGKLEGIEALRGIAAVAVVLYHAARHMDRAHGAPNLMAWFQPGHGGVDLFFVLSGFIILHVHRADIDRPERLGRYAWRRFVRLMPIYWIALGLTALMLLAGGNAVMPGWFAWSATLLPTHGEPLLGVAWTLQHELLFYAAFAVLILNRSAGIAVMAAWLLWIGVRTAGVAPGIGPERLSSPYNVEFFLGMGVAVLLASGRMPRGPGAATLGVALTIANGLAESLDWIDGYGAVARWTGGVSAAVLIAGLAAWERERRIVVPAFLRRLGSASYAIYLFQFIGMGIAWQIWVRAGLDSPGRILPAFLFIAVVGVMGGMIAHSLIERPMLGWLRGRDARSGSGRQAVIQ